MVAYGRVYDSHHLQAECKEPGSAPESYVRVTVTYFCSLFVPSALLWIEMSAAVISFLVS